MTSPEEQKKEWFEINAPHGKQLGYPDCCIKEFCDQPPGLLKGNATDDDKLRYQAACIDGQFTGFIPCREHARQIVDGKITLASLIKERSQEFPEFPNHMLYTPGERKNNRALLVIGTLLLAILAIVYFKKK